MKGLTPDGVRYLSMAEGLRVPRPFHYRWALPLLLRQNRTAWLTVQWVSLLSLSGLVSWESGYWWAGLLYAWQVRKLLADREHRAPDLGAG